MSLFIWKWKYNLKWLRQDICTFLSISMSDLLMWSFLNLDLLQIEHCFAMVLEHTAINMYVSYVYNKYLVSGM